MSNKKQTDIPEGLALGHEENEIGLKGIMYFGVGLLLLIVITFGLMMAFLGAMKDYWRDNAGPANPLGMSDKERLPAEPRLQSAPGFGVDSDKGRVNLELSEPSREYREVRRQWDERNEKGQVDPKTGMVAVMPIEKAKEKFLSSGAKAKSGPEAEAFFKESRRFVSDASAGRANGETRR